VKQESTRPSLLSRLRDPQDAAAWREFDEKYRDLLRRYCGRHGLQAADTEDVCQTVFLALTRSLSTFRFDPARGRFRNYLGSMVANAIRQQRSGAKKAARTLEDSVLEVLATPQGEAIEAAWEEEWSHHHLRRAMHTLRTQVKPESLAAFERLLQGESIADVALACQMTAEGVHKIKQRIGERLRAEVERQVLEEELPVDPAG
jgi:RNA polymerase sigma factor (sigma-70 family)